MELNIASVEIEPKRHTFGNVARRLGEDRPASRYEESMYDAQPTENFHYRPQWEPEFEIYDKARTKIKMNDWYDLLDPRKFHYMTYVSTRASQNAANLQSFDFIEKRSLVNFIKQENLQKAFDFLTPLRHYEYGANMNNLAIVDRVYGTAMMSATMFHAEDRLGMAQHITKMILLLGNNDVTKLDSGKEAWMNDSKWQGLRKAVEDSLVVKDPIRLFVKQNVVFDAFVIPLMINEFSKEMAANEEMVVPMLSEFITSWYEETVKWLDSVIKVMANESSENKELLIQWIKEDIEIMEDAMEPLSEFSVNASELLSSTKLELINRLNKSGITL
ncbi:phenol hydroxylase [Poseidonibacter ostreae]|uniref:Phenol hydroxylase n=1 Tax=Poseidonibacter ostreae TaxID=2654171 RepID=A0A6L4WNH8_9BACT|nr:phenol hydroxylase [Poseidonibacter ostreae]KAB7884587.1 phenol hydroxylase [Poseidonibacter ostreae]KAB7888073.1 phenol hydroxylase [Poseidonibacter ostreae]